MILTVGNIKGGVGKSMFACNIAVALSYLSAPESVLLIDGDKQGSAATFTQARVERLGAAGFTCVRVQGKEVRAQVRTLKSKFEHIIIDAGGQDNPSLRAGLVVSEQVLVPVAPQAFDLWAMDEMVALIEEAQVQNEELNPVVFLNRAFSSGGDNLQTLEILMKDFPSLQLSMIPVVSRKAWSNASSEGLSVLDIRRDQKALYEFRTVLLSIDLSENDIDQIYNRNPLGTSLIL